MVGRPFDPDRICAGQNFQRRDFCRLAVAVLPRGADRRGPTGGLVAKHRRARGQICRALVRAQPAGGVADLGRGFCDAAIFPVPV